MKKSRFSEEQIAYALRIVSMSASIYRYESRKRDEPNVACDLSTTTWGWVAGQNVLAGRLLWLNMLA